MPASSSDLSSAKYGYDFVVATTQASINSMMLNFLASRQEPTVNVCFIADEQGKPQAIPYDILKMNAKGSDPFPISDGSDVATNPDLRNLLKARFMMGFRAKLGVPPMDDPTKIPDLVTLGADTAAVKFNMLTSEFTIVQLDPGSGWNPHPSWMKAMQPKNSPWIFTSNVDLRLSTVADTAYSHLPEVVQDQIKNMSGSAFSIQQLLFDLTNARMANIPTITGVTPGTLCYMALQQYFIGAYFTQMQKGGQPLLGCSIVHQDAPVSTMTLTNMNMQVSPFVDGIGLPILHPASDEADLATINYLCAADGAFLPSSVPFSWNWVDKSEVKDHDGVLSINRKTFANYFRQQLKSYVPQVCIQPFVKVKKHFLDVEYKMNFQHYQSPTSVTTPSTGQTVLKYEYFGGSSEQAGVGGVLGAMTIKSSFDLTVDFVGNTIVIKQHLVIFLYLRIAATSKSGNVFDKTITDTYTIGVGAKSQLVAPKSEPVIEDKGGDVNTDAFQNFFTGFNSFASQIKQFADFLASPNFEQIPVDTARSYIFPGGQTFIFKHAAFSDHQDLTALISYADPKRPVATIPTLDQSS